MMNYKKYTSPSGFDFIYANDSESDLYMVIPIDESNSDYQQYIIHTNGELLTSKKEEA